MCACRQKKSFLIADILSSDGKKKPYKNLSNEPSKPLVCNKEERDKKTEAKEDNLTKFNVTCEVQNELEISKVRLEQRRNTFPLYPMAMKPNYYYREKDAGIVDSNQFNYYSDPVLNTNHILRNHLAANRFVSHQLTMRHFGFDRGPNCCSSWWGMGVRRKGGQVRFTAAQTTALERRFNASKYLSPDERRSLASSLRLSDRQVKTWFQNRRAKWRRAAPSSADAASPRSPPSTDSETPSPDDQDI